MIVFISISVQLATRLRERCGPLARPAHLRRSTPRDRQQLSTQIRRHAACVLHSSRAHSPAANRMPGTVSAPSRDESPSRLRDLTSRATLQAAIATSAAARPRGATLLANPRDFILYSSRRAARDSFCCANRRPTSLPRGERAVKAASAWGGPARLARPYVRRNANRLSYCTPGSVAPLRWRSDKAESRAAPDRVS